MCDFEKIDLTKYDVNISKNEKDKAYKDFLDGQKRFISIENKRPIKNNDKVLVSLSSKDENVPEVLKKTR